jgi:hypothetical protein
MLSSPSDVPLDIEEINWVRTAAPILVPNPDVSAFDHQTTYNASLARNLDRTPYKDGNGDLYLYYTGDNTIETDYDQIGLAMGPDLESLVRWGEGPVIATGEPGDPDAGDAQVTHVWVLGGVFHCFYHGNATPPGDFDSGDHVVPCLATSVDGKVFTKQGALFTYGPPGSGDADGMYFPKYVPNAPGGPRIYYTGQKIGGGRGLMGAYSPSGNPAGPYTRISTRQLFSAGNTFLSDAWYDEGEGVYCFLWFPTDMNLATSNNGFTIVNRGLVLARRAGEWDTSINRGQHYVFDGVDVLVYDAGGSAGIGYASGAILRSRAHLPDGGTIAWSLPRAR